MCGQTKPEDLTQLSIETLMDMEVSSVAKKEQKISQTAAAIYVITQEDIRRSGLTSVPELLRMVPGLEVAHIDASDWAISARGFNSRHTKKVLVLIDGRSLYWPGDGTVFWDAQDLMLENIERIEVVRGPGATLWGISAINGVINIITKSARNTQGALLSVGAGVQERGFAAARFGGRIGSKGDYRFYTKAFTRGQFVDDTGAGAADQWHGLRGGFRTDWALSSRDSLMVQGDLHHGVENEITAFFSLAPPFSVDAGLQTKFTGGNLLGRWSRIYSKNSDLALQFYYDTDTRSNSTARLFVQTGGFDFQHRFALGERNDVLWGAGYRRVQDSFRNTFYESFEPSSRNDSLYDAFVQDEITLVRDRLHVTAGVRFENVPYTGYHAEPNGRILWTPSEKQTIWASVASAKRAPTRSTRESRRVTSVSGASDGTPSIQALLGSQRFKDEAVLAIDLGYRVQPNNQISLDLATFYNRYSDLQTLEPAVPFRELDPAPAHIVIPRYFSNLMHGKSYGAELSVDWKVNHAWKLYAGYSFLRLELRRNPESLAINAEDAEGDSPRHHVQFRSQWDLSKKLEFDQSLYYVGPLDSQLVPAYTRMDLRLGWHPTNTLDISVVGQNLLSPRHEEFARPDGTLDVRKAYVKLTWKF